VFVPDARGGRLSRKQESGLFTPRMRRRKKRRRRK
jgi:hypothetical protein